VASQYWRQLQEQGARFGMGPAVFTLILINVAVFLLQSMSKLFFQGDYLFVYMAYQSDLVVGGLQVWRVFTYMFLHANFIHLLFNMMGLIFLGSRLEGYWGSRYFTWYFLASGVGGGILYGLFSYISGSGNPMLGASGAVAGVLLAFGMVWPNSIIYLLFFPIKAKFLVILAVFMSVLGFGPTNVAHMCHLGGIVTGFVFLWLTTGGRFGAIPVLPGQKRRRTSSTGYGQAGGSQGWGTTSSPQAGSFSDRLKQSFIRWRTRMRMKVVDSQKSQTKQGKPGNGKPYGGQKPSRVDEVLEKISREGITSLTPEEKDILRRASRQD